MVNYNIARDILDQMGYTDYIIDPDNKSLRIDKITLKHSDSELLRLLESFETLEGDLEFDHLDQQELNCLNQLKSIRLLRISNCETLKSISGFSSLSRIRSLIIEKNPALESITGFDNLFSQQTRIAGNIKIINNNILTGISFLHGLENVGLSLYLHHNNLTSLDGLEKLHSVGASLSLSSNDISSLNPLSELKQVGGMLGLVNNNLTDLSGLENLKRVNTVLWNGNKRSIAFNYNEGLKDISALRNVLSDDDSLVIISDSDVMQKVLPEADSDFFKNSVVFRDRNNINIYQSYRAVDFPKIKSIKVNNAISNELYPVKNLIQGKGRGFDHIPPYSSISKSFWSTEKVDKGCYFDSHQPFQIDLELDFEEEFDAIAIWPSRITYGNSVKEFLLQFGSSVNVLGQSVPVHLTANGKNPFDAELFQFSKVKAKYIRMTVLSNHSDVGIGGQCVDFQEIAVVRNYEETSGRLREGNDRGFKGDLIQAFLSDQLDDYHYQILSINHEFSLDDVWYPGMTYREFIAARGLGGEGRQLRRIRLATIDDKILMHYFLKEYGIKGMPVRLTSNRLDDAFFSNVRKIYKNGLKSFVLKVSHLGDSVGVYRIKDGKHIPPNETTGHNEMTGKSVDFDYLEQEIRKQWNNQQYHEEWRSNAIPPGVILEELLEDATEIKVSVVFGKAVCFFVRIPGFPCYDCHGNALSNVTAELPEWWQNAVRKAEEVARIFKGDHLRIDIFHRSGELLVCEVTWNGFERYPTYPLIESALNYGYAFRRKYIKNKG